MKKYIKQAVAANRKKSNSKVVLKKINDDFISNNINMSYEDIEFKAQEFQLKAFVIVENQLKLDKWRLKQA